MKNFFTDSLLKDHFRPSKAQFHTKNDPQDLRMGDLKLSPEGASRNSVAAGTVLQGYPDDEGILNNGGRVGAAFAPKTIREVFWKTTPPAGKPLPTLVDLGDLITTPALVERHRYASQNLQNFLEQGFRAITLGGGHDYGYPDGRAFLKSVKNQKPVVVNFDAHLDVRPVGEKINSGTPFYRLLQEFKDQMHFFEIGLQPHCNSESHAKWARDQGAHLLWWNEGDNFNAQPEKVLSFIQQTVKTGPLFVSLDIDGLQNSEAPGCSQSWPMGFSFQAMREILHTLYSRFDPRVLGIYEVSPPLDVDLRTSKLAALFMHQFLFHSAV